MTPTSTIASSPVLKTYKRPVNFGDVVLKALVERMDPEARTVAPQWRSLASSLGVSTMTLGRYIQRLKEDGRIETVEESPECRNSGDANLLCSLGAATNGHPSPTWLPNSRKRYFIKETVNADWAASVEPQFERMHISKQKRRYKSATARNELGERILGYLRERMASDTHLVKAAQVEIGKVLGYAPCSVSAAIRKLIAEKRLVKVVGKARRGMGNDATVYRVIVDEHDLEPLPAPTPPRPRPVQKPAEIFTCLSLENFKNSGRREISFDRISAVAGKSGADRTQIFDAMRVLHGIAQGKDISAFPALWFGTDWPTTLSISLNTLRHGRLTYSVTLQRIDDNRVRVSDERLAGRFETLLIRRKHFYTHLATKDRNGIGTTSFALCDAANILDADDPIVQFKRQLVELWLLNPDPNAMKSEIGFGVVNADICGFGDFVTCMVMQQKREAFAAAMRDAVLHLCPDLVGYTVEKNAKGVPYLAVRHRSDLDPKGTPFALLDSAEKILFLVAFVCAMNGHSAPAPIVWLSPFNWLGERERLAADRLIRAAFANRGQMIMLV